MSIELTTLTAPPGQRLDFEDAIYRGVPVEVLIYERHAEFLEDEMLADPASDGFTQECYLGYDPTDDFFVVGYDLNRGGGYQKVSINPVTGEIRNLVTVAHTVSFYDGLYDRLHGWYPNLIDLRLD